MRPGAPASDPQRERPRTQAATAKPVGGRTRSAASANARRRLLEETGFLHDPGSDDSDLPRSVARPGGPTPGRITAFARTEAARRASVVRVAGD